MVAIEPGRPDDAGAAAELIVETDRELFAHCTGGDPQLWVELAGWEWRSPRGVYSHAMGQVVRRGEDLIGLLIAYPQSLATSLDWSFSASCSGMPLDRWERAMSGMPLAKHLFPAVPADAYYIQNIATHPSVRGGELKLGRRLMEWAFADARAGGCASCHLDVAASSPAVAFYQRLGFEVLIRTDVPRIPGNEHYRMVRDL